MRTLRFAWMLLAVHAGCSGDNQMNTPMPDMAKSPDLASPAPFTIPEPTIVVSPVSTTGHDRFHGVAFDAQGNLFTVGQVADSTMATADFRTVLAKFDATGKLDTSFGDQGYAILNVAIGTNGELFRNLVIQSTGKIVIAGTVEQAGASEARERDVALVRFLPNGTPDPQFGSGGVITFDFGPGVASGNNFLSDSAWGIKAYPDDRLVISGGMVRPGFNDTDFVILRLTADGAGDNSFGTNGQFALNLQIADATAGGMLKDNNASPRHVTILPGTQGIIGAGYQPVPGKDTSPVVFKVDDTGHLVTSFGSGGAFVTQLLEEQTETYIAVPQGDKLVTTGYGKVAEMDTTDIVSLRLNADGSLDTTYGNNGMVRVDVGGFGDNSRGLVVLPDQRILLAGGGRPTMDNVDGWIALLDKDGAPDPNFSSTGWKTFNLGGPADFLTGVALSPDGKRAAFAGMKGVGASPMPADANDDGVLVILQLQQ